MGGWGGGGFNFELCFFFVIVVGKYFSYFELKLSVFVKAKTVSNRDICFNYCANMGTFHYILRHMAYLAPTPIQLGLRKMEHIGTGWSVDRNVKERN